jgi:mRNA interferase MazF
MAHPRRGEVCLVNLDPTLGAEVRKTRPALVIQNDVGNEVSPVTIVAAITSQIEGRPYPTEVRVPAGHWGLRTDSAVLLNQIRTIDWQRLIRRLGWLPRESMERVNHALALSLGLTEI